ncbi:MAG: AAA family ATPase [Rhodobacteraceae bacterium]|nr:AAA family ATPase [Paracoccaceae bacterium]
MAHNTITEPAIRACTVCRDVQNFDLLIEDMEQEFPQAWGELTVVETLAFINDPEAASLELLAIALDDEDEPQTSLILKIIEQAAARSIRVLLIAEALSPILLHQLLRAGADDFVPYPLPENALREAIERLRRNARNTVHAASRGHDGMNGAEGGMVIAVQALAGGAGATSFAVNLAWELCQIKSATPPSVCILDFDFQYGSVSTYLDIPRTEKVYEMLSQTNAMDADSFRAALQSFQDKLHVLTAPADMLPLDILSPDEIGRIIATARGCFDIIIIDMPQCIVQWTETVLNASAQYFALMELDMRCAQNTLRLIRALKADSVPMDCFRFVLNRAPRFTDLAGKSRAKRLSESLGLEFFAQLPDGGAQHREANDHGLPLAEYAPKNPVAREIRKIALAMPQVETAAKIAAQ